MSTLAHEWWHASRRSGPTIRHFEEGSADAFTVEALQKAIGLKTPITWQAYPIPSSAIELIGADLDLNNWYLPSRTAINVVDWLRETLIAAGYDLKAIEDLLMYTVAEEDWLVRVKRMLSAGRNP